MIKLNLPILDKLDACQHILIAGMGGGFTETLAKRKLSRIPLG